MLNFRTTLVAVAVALSSGLTHGAVIDWGTHASGETTSRVVAPGSFSDIFKFTLGDALVLESSVTVAAQTPPTFFIQSGKYYLFGNGVDLQPGGGDDVELSDIGGWSYDGTTGALQHTVNLAAGAYHFAVQGDATGFIGGRYRIASSVSPIPEPSETLMILAGLGLLAFSARRKTSA